MGLKVEKDSPQVTFPPPFMLFGTFILGGMIHFVYPMGLIPESYRILLGPLFIGVGLGNVILCARLFRKVGTEVAPWKTTHQIIDSHFYRYSRNPIYCSFFIFGLGVAFAVNSLWIALLQIPLAAWIDRFVVAKEEKYLKKKFSQKYENYQRRVRRWI